MKILLNYNKDTGEVTDEAGVLILTWMGLERCEFAEDKSHVVELVSMGLSADDLIKLKYNNII